VIWPMKNLDRLGRLAASEPSRFLSQHLSRLDTSLPVLDAPSGFGRNSLFLARQGHRVVGTDIDAERVNFVAWHAKQTLRGATNLSFAVCDLRSEFLPFESEAFGSVVIVHFVPSDWNGYLAVLRSGGILLFETMGGQGQNYLELPARGEIKSLLEPTCTILVHREHPVGPPERNAVTVRLIAQKR
jgi:SAM-dependent methyltransferase